MGSSRLRSRPDQRSRLLGALFESIDADVLPQRGLRLEAAPRGAWRNFFPSLVLERAGNGGLPREYHCPAID